MRGNTKVRCTAGICTQARNVRSQLLRIRIPNPDQLTRVSDTSVPSRILIYGIIGERGSVRRQYAYVCIYIKANEYSVSAVGDTRYHTSWTNCNLQSLITGCINEKTDTYVYFRKALDKKKASTPPQFSALPHTPSVVGEIEL